MEGTRIELKYGAAGFIFPVTPGAFDLDFGVENVKVNVNDLGEILLKGKRKLRSISWSCFFPRKYYDFCQVSEGELRQATEYVTMLQLLAAENVTVMLNITDYVSMPVVIESFPTSQDDGTGDISYSITLTEDRDVDTPSAETQTAKRPTKAVQSHLYKWKKGDTWKKVAKKETGKTDNWSKLKKNNQKTTDKAVMAYKKKHPSEKKIKDEVALIGVNILIK